MIIDQVAINAPDIKGQQNLQANNGPDVSGRTDNGTNGSKAEPVDLVTVTKPSTGQSDRSSDRQANKTNALSNAILNGAKGVIGLDDDKNVVVRFFDKKGKVVEQYPPEDYLKMMKELNQIAESMFHKKI